MFQLYFFHRRFVEGLARQRMRNGYALEELEEENAINESNDANECNEPNETIISSFEESHLQMMQDQLTRMHTHASTHLGGNCTGE